MKLENISIEEIPCCFKLAWFKKCKQSQILVPKAAEKVDEPDFTTFQALKKYCEENAFPKPIVGFGGPRLNH